MDNNSRKTNFDSQESAKNSINSLTQENVTESNAIQIPGISLPKGGGALKGIDEKFEVNAANGTAAFNIPLPITPGRNGYSPSLTLSYNSGGGNSPYGLGWSLDFPSIQRKTDKRLPRYRDGIDEDVFMFSGAEDLVPFLTEVTPGDWQILEYQDQIDDKIKIRRYRPRIEGSFARIEKISHPVHGVYWKVTTRENVVTIFGRDANARIADPGDDSRIFQWLPEFGYDDKGNWIKYKYKEENLENVPNVSYENNRLNGITGFTNQYLKRIQYGNRNPYYDDPGKPYDPQTPADNDHFFEVVFDYGEHGASSPTPKGVPGQLWDYRPDAFSNYRAGFEIRTNRLCKRVLMFHNFEELGDEPCLVRSLDFQYTPSSINHSGQAEVTYLESVTQTGYTRKLDGTYSNKSLPPVQFEYQRLNWEKKIKTVTRENIVNAPVGLTNNYQWVDLYGEGIPGILTEQGGAWFYKSNLGDIDEHGDVNFTAVKKVFPKPSFVGISSGVLSIRDLEADGQKQVVVNSPGLQGYFQLTTDNDWEPFRAFEEIANIDLQDPNLRMIDLNGDGQPELVVSEDNVFVWYEADGKEGHKAAEFAAKTFDEEKGPAIIFADREQTIFLADMSGDGMTDIVRIRSGEICYWANMGYGRFSAKVNMENAPLFDHPGSFNPEYLHLADVSGTGPADILYLGKNKFKAYINLSGNAWSEAHEIEPFFPIDGNCQLSVIDLLGTGTSCITWSSDLPAFTHAPMRYIDLMGGKKPHVLVHYQNNLGKETTLEYKSSTHFYLKDKLAGKPWITKLPFPVQVVSKLIVEEKIADVRFTNEYRYHHGYYDHPEREFRGFGMVEQVDTEHYETWKANSAGTHLEKSDELYQKPVLTKTWFHTGAFLDKERILTQFKEEYWYEEYNRVFPEAPLTITEPALKDARVTAAENIRDSAIIDKLNGDQWREALRACKGMVLRQEVFALDAPAVGADDSEIKKQAKPYTAATHNCNIQLLQPGADNPYMVFLVTESEAITLHYERNETDPRIAHTLNTKIDELGNILETASVVYPRKQEIAALPQETKDQQKKTLITYTQNKFAKPTNGEPDINKPGAYRLRLPSETKTFEITGLQKVQMLYRLEDFNDVLGAAAQEIEYHLNPTIGTPQRRLIEHIRTYYYRDDLEDRLALHQFDAIGLPYESYQLAYTPSLLQHIFAEKIPDPADTMSQGKFVHSEGDENWWIPSGVVQYIDTAAAENVSAAQSRFYSPISYTDPFGSQTKVAYYKDYFLLLQETEDALQNKVKVELFNFRTLAPRQIRDINDNLSEVLVDELGLVKAAALQGKDLDNDGLPELEAADNLNGLEEITENEAVDIQDFFQTEDSVILDSIGRSLLQQATSRFIYDFDTYRNNGKPVVVAAINRETHHAHLAAGEQSKLQFAFQYSDGVGNVAMTKVQAEPGVAKQADVQADGSYTITDVDTAALDPKRLRWVGTGRTVLNNKGNPVKQYEPYFSVTPYYEDAGELVESGVTPILYYDSLGRLIKTELPDKTFSKVEFDAWRQVTYDQNDTVKDSQWYNDRINHLIDTELTEAGKDPANEEEAAQKAGKHYNTPPVLHIDTMGRPILIVEHNRDAADNDEFYNTIIQLDIEGNARRITDARDNPVMEYKYDMLGHRVYQKSMDAGERWMLKDITGEPLYTRDSRGSIIRTTYDPLHRPVTSELRNETHADWIVVGCTRYGDEQGLPQEWEAEARARNLRGQVYRAYDQSGLVTNISFDFKGNILELRRRLALEYENDVHWRTALTLEPDREPDEQLMDETFSQVIEYDALNRVTRQYNWHKGSGSRAAVVEPHYNRRSLLEQEDVVPDAVKRDGDYEGGTRTAMVREITYNEKGQRLCIEYGSGTTTSYTYDTETFRLIHLETRRHMDSQILQDLYYTYDPTGNITEIADNAQPTIFFNNSEIDPHSGYTYDALYRLIRAEGREHAGQLRHDAHDNWHDCAFRKKYHPNDAGTWRNYTEHYIYDSVGNILSVQHRAHGDTANSWTRQYQYEQTSNRLLATGIGSAPVEHYPATPSLDYLYNYNVHGSMTAMSHLETMAWDFTEHLHYIARTAGTQAEGDEVCPDTSLGAWYRCDADKKRTRKRVVKPGGLVEERLYLGGIEVFRKFDGGGTLTLERETLHVMDDQQRIAMVETKTVADGIEVASPDAVFRYQLNNHLGSSSLELDEGARVISYEEYHPYGSTSYQSVSGDVEVSAKRYRYTGMERDEETGLNYHTARYYAPWLGRWTATDPEGLSDGVNIYRYSRNNPLNIIDPTGTDGDRPRLDIDKILTILEDITRKVELEAPLDEPESSDQPAEETVREANLTGLLQYLLPTHLRVWGIGEEALPLLPPGSIPASNIIDVFPHGNPSTAWLAAAWPFSEFVGVASIPPGHYDVIVAHSLGWRTVLAALRSGRISGDEIHAFGGVSSSFDMDLFGSPYRSPFTHIYPGDPISRLRPNLPENTYIHINRGDLLAPGIRIDFSRAIPFWNDLLSGELSFPLAGDPVFETVLQTGAVLLTPYAIRLDTGEHQVTLSFAQGGSSGLYAVYRWTPGEDPRPKGGHDPQDYQGLSF